MSTSPLPVMIFTAETPDLLEEQIADFFLDTESSKYLFGGHTVTTTKHGNFWYTVSFYLKSINYEKHHA